MERKLRPFSGRFSTRCRFTIPPIPELVVLTVVATPVTSMAWPVAPRDNENDAVVVDSTCTVTISA